MAEIQPEYPHDPFDLFLQPPNPVRIFVSSRNLGAYVDAREADSNAFGSLTSRPELPNDPFLQMLHSPAADRSTTLLRQSVVQALVGDPEARAGLALSAKQALELQETIVGLFAVPDSEIEKADARSGGRFGRRLAGLTAEYTPKSYLELYTEAASGHDSSGSQDALQWVGEALQQLPAQVDGVRTWAAQDLPAAPHEFFVAASEHAKGVVGQLPTMTADSLPEAMRQGDHDYLVAVRDGVESVANEARKTLALTGFARLVIADGMQQVAFGDEETAFTAGSNFYKAPKTKKGIEQVRNDSLPDVPINVLAGGNMTGKSFNLESQFAQAEVGQAMGFAPSTDPRAVPVPSLAFVDRSSTAAGSDLSAFGSEVRNWAAAIQATEPGGRLFADEAFSTTSPQEQAILIEATLNYLQSRGVQSVVATHNETAVARLADRPEVAISHLGFSVVDGAPVYTRQLEPGPDDSHALEVAAGLGMPEDILHGAKDYLEGVSAVVRRRQPELPSIAEYDEAEREQLKKMVGSPQVFIPGADYLVERQTADRDYYTGRPSTVLEFKSRPRDPNAHWSNVEGVSPILDCPKPDWQFYDLARERFGQLGMQFATGVLNAGNHQDRRMLLEVQRFYRAVAEDPELGKGLVREADKLRLLIFGINTIMRESATQDVLGSFVDDSFDSLGFSYKPDTRYLREVVATTLDLHGLEVNEEMQARLDILASLDEYYTESARAVEVASDKIRIRGYYEGPEDVSASDEVYARWRDRLLQLCESRPGFVHEFADDDPDTGEHIVSRYPDHANLLATVTKEIKAYLKSLPKLRIDQGDFDPNSELGRRRLDRISQTVDRFFELEGDETVPQSSWFFPGATATFVALQYLDSGERVTQGVTDALRRIDSVAAHQYANYLDWLAPKIEKQGKADGPTIYQQIMTEEYWETMSPGNIEQVSLEAERLRYLLQFADNLRRNGFQPVEFCNAPRIQIDQGWNPLGDPLTQVRNSWTIGDREQFLMVTGANMSGKTNGLNQLAMTQAIAQVTGMAPAEAARLPLFDKVVYIDRADTSKQSEGLSAFGTEVSQWIDVLAAANNNPAMLVLVDEAFSTTSPLYQEALTHAVVINMARAGAVGAIATHNHAVVNRLSNENPGTVRPVHFDTRINDQGEAEFSYRLADGHDQSKAIAVARAVGGLPAELLDEAERLSRAYDNDN